MASVDTKAKTSHVHFASANVQIVDLGKAITAAGYDAKDTKRHEDVHAASPQYCQKEK